MTLVHCSNCDKNFPIMEFDTQYHSYDCKFASKEEHDRLPFKDRYFGELIGISAMIGILVLFVGMIVLFGNGAKAQECLDSHMSTINELNANNKITYREPKEICDVTYYTQYDTYSYSYYMEKNYGKPSWSVYTDCENAIWNKEEKNFVCPDGRIANELRMKF